MLFTKKSALALISIILLNTLWAFDVEPGKIAWVEYKGPGTGYDYVLFLPADYGQNPDKEYCFIYQLHGLGAGALQGGLTEKLLTDENYAANFKYILAAPQSTGVDSWHDHAKLERVLEDVIGRYNINPNAVWVTGQSMGGQAAFKAPMRRPDLVTAAIPMSCANPGQASNDIANLLDVYIWGFHGLSDTVTSPSHTINTIQAISNQGGTLARITMTPGQGHTWTYWNSIFEMPELWTWLSNCSGSPTGIIISNLALTPLNGSSAVVTPVTVSGDFYDDGSIVSVTADLSEVGGGASVALSQSGNTWTLNDNIAAGLAAGEYEIIIVVTDNSGEVRKKHLVFTAADGAAFPTGISAQRTGKGTNEISWNNDALGSMAVYVMAGSPVNDDNLNAAILLDSDLAPGTVSYTHRLADNPQTMFFQDTPLYYAVKSVTNATYPVISLVGEVNATRQGVISSMDPVLPDILPTGLIVTATNDSNILQWDPNGLYPYRILMSTTGPITDANQAAAVVLADGLPTNTSQFVHVLADYPESTVLTSTPFYYAVISEEPLPPPGGYFEGVFNDTGAKSWEWLAVQFSDWSTLTLAPYASLSFAVRVKSGFASDMKVTITGAATALNITSYGVMDSSWNKITIPLADFNPGADCVGIIMQRNANPETVVEFDEIIFEGGTDKVLYGDADPGANIFQTGGSTVEWTKFGSGGFDLGSVRSLISAGTNASLTPVYNFYEPPPVPVPPREIQIHSSGDDEPIYLGRLETGTKVTIYTVNSIRIWEHEMSDTADLEWELVNADDMDVAPGLYLCHIQESNGHAFIRKLIIEKNE